MRTLIIVVIVLMALVGGLIGYNIANQDEQDLPLVSFGGGGMSPLQSTTTQQVLGNLDLAVLKTGSGILGSIIITDPGAGAIDLYDATTTDIIAGNNIRAATSSIHIAHIMVTPTAGVYEYNTAFVNGLLIDISNDDVSSSTITWD